jgi:hypothetical protein
MHSLSLIIFLSIGAALGMRFKALILFPACILSAAGAALDGYGVVVIVLTVTGLQVGYLAGALMRGLKTQTECTGAETAIAIAPRRRRRLHLVKP